MTQVPRDTLDLAGRTQSQALSLLREHGFEPADVVRHETAPPPRPPARDGARRKAPKAQAEAQEEAGRGAERQAELEGEWRVLRWRRQGSQIEITVARERLSPEVQQVLAPAHAGAF